MNILNQLIQTTTSTEELTIFLSKNSHSVELSDFFVSQPYRDLLLHRQQIEEFILPAFDIYRNLDFSISNNASFLSYLLEFSERFGLITEFERLFQLHKEKHLEISNRLKAASLYLIGITKIQDYFDRTNTIIDSLKIAHLEEEDSHDAVTSTFIGLYAHVVKDFSHNKKIIKFRTLLLEAIEEEERSFLNTQIVRDALTICPTDNVTTYDAIQQVLDTFLSRTKPYVPFNKHRLLLEKDTAYTNALIDIERNFTYLQQFCSGLYQQVQDNAIFNSLDRGVAILTKPEQLLAYLHSYGKMHHAKIVTAFEKANLPESVLKKDVEVYDWGCGQGLASFIFHEYFQPIHSNTILIEPSEIALARAAFHIKEIAPNTDITTINKDFNTLLNDDIKSHPERTKVHLFSNVLDMELFSMSQFLELIQQNFNGTNYLFCISPRVNQRKVNRLNNFLEFFREKSGFNEYVNLNYAKGEWKNGWTCSIRVFKVEIS